MRYNGYTSFEISHGVNQDEKERRLQDFKAFVNKVLATNRILVTQISEWQWRFEFDGNKFDLLPVSRKVIDWNVFLWCDGQWQTRINSIERRIR
jgi:hypothetical protein